VFKIDLRRPKAGPGNLDEAILYTAEPTSCYMNNPSALLSIRNPIPGLHTKHKLGCASEEVFKIDLRRPKAALQNPKEGVVYIPK
jgi:hypothetical protein